MLQAERRRVLEIRSSGQVAADVIAEVLTLLDVEESMLDIATQERDELRTTSRFRQTGETCPDLDERPVVEVADDQVCQACVDKGDQWVSLRICLDCGEIGCCDSSPNQHASAHFRETTHPVMQSAEPGEDWRWCFVHHKTA